MQTISDYFQYSQLANAAYINLDGQVINTTNLVREANDQGRIPTLLAERLFDSTKSNGETVWAVKPNGYHGNDDTGYAATLFEKDGEKVLAIRGTEPSGSQL